MRRRISLVALLLVLVMLVSACAVPGNKEQSQVNEPTQNEAEQNSALADVAFVKNESWVPVPITKTIKILTIGNEQSVDSAQYLVPMARELGIDVVLGHLFIPGASIETCAGRTSSSNTTFNFYKFSGESWSVSSGYSLQKALQEEAWEYVILSQTQGLAGVLETIQGEAREKYFLSSLATYINYNTKLGGSTKYTTNIVWNMTWAFESTATYGDFGKYDFNQETMYAALVSTTKGAIEHSEVKKYVKSYIPTGTAFQNMRSSYWFDGITRDGSNLSYMGKILSSMMLLRSVVGADINALTFESYEVLAFAKPDLAVLKESVNNAYTTPDQVTQSQFPRT